MFNAIYYPSKMSVAAIGVLQQTSSSLRNTFSMLQMLGNGFSEQIDQIKKGYDTMEVHNQVKEGDQPYPPEKQDSAGMSIEIR